MKFWQKTYLSIILIFLIAFDAAIFFLISRSYSLSREQFHSTALNEQYAIQQSLQSRLADVSSLYHAFNAKNLRMYAAPYGDYYAGQNIFIELYYGDDVVYSNFPSAMAERPELEIGAGEKNIVERNVDGILYYIVANRLDEPDPDIKFVYIKNIQALADYKAQMIYQAVMIGVIVSAVLSVLTLLLVLTITRPIRMLNQASEEIAAGYYQKRVGVKSNDEIGEFARNFNSMADSVETHIRQLSDLTEERQRFIDYLAHEMRTPITAILGYSEFLRYANHTEEEGAQAIAYIIHQSERMKNLSQKLMDLARLTNMKIVLQTINLNETLAFVEKTLAQSIEMKRIQVKKDLQVGRMEGDKDLIESLLLNIVENALRASPDGGEIAVKTRLGADGFTLTVLDYGQGISDEDRRKVFEPFYRVDKSRSRSYGGAGLGLAICRQICKIHHAEIEIFSRSDMGTSAEIKFTTLPQLDDDSEMRNP